MIVDPRYNTIAAGHGTNARTGGLR